jgi:hypothetical protein
MDGASWLTVYGLRLTARSDVGVGYCNLPAGHCELAALGRGYGLR